MGLSDRDTDFGTRSPKRNVTEAGTDWASISTQPVISMRSQDNLVLPGTGSGSIGSFMSQDKLSGTSLI